MKSFKLLACGVAIIVSSIGVCLGLNFLFGFFDCGEGVGTSVASGVTIGCAIRNFKAALKTLNKGEAGSDDRYFYGEACNNCAVAYFESHDEESAKEWFEKAFEAGYARVDMRLYDLLHKASITQGASQ